MINNQDVIYARDIDGTGSMHICSKNDPGAIQYSRTQQLLPSPSIRPEQFIECWMLANGVTLANVADYQLSIKHESLGTTSYAIEPKTHRDNPEVSQLEVRGLMDAMAMELQRILRLIGYGGDGCQILKGSAFHAIIQEILARYEVFKQKEKNK